MPAPLDCLGIKCWQELLATRLAPDEVEHCEHHLKSCPACQERLDRAEKCGDELLRLARKVGDPTIVPANPNLVQILDRLHRMKCLDQTAPAEPPDLYFLHPTDRPGILGTLADYEVREVIGQGGMGVVLKAFDPALRRLVAIKVVLPILGGCATALRRFTREAQAAASVCHDHIVPVYGVHEAEGLPYLVMQYVAGESLQERLDHGGRLRVEEVVCIGLQTASGLAAAHAQGLIHRDIKPSNLLLEDGLAKVKITDFGLARMTDDVGLTQAGVVAGTPEYMAPEQARADPIDHRADLFSLGSVLYACCTGIPPFRARTTLGVLHQVSELTPGPIRSLNPEVPAWLETLIVRLMAKDPAQRWQSAAEVAALLEGYLAHLRQPELAAAPKLPSSPLAIDTRRQRIQPRRFTRKWLLAVAGIVSLLAVLAAIGARVLPFQDTGALGANLLNSSETKSLDPKAGLVCLLVNKNSGRCLSIAGKSDNPGARAVQGPRPDRAGATEHWILIGTGKAFRLLNEKTHLVLEIGNENTHKGAPATQARDQATKTNQHWTFEPVGDGYLLRPGHCQLVLAIAANARYGGALALLCEYLPGVLDQLWELRPTTISSGRADDQTQTPSRTAFNRDYYWSFKGAPENRQHLELIGPTAAAVTATPRVSFQCSACGKKRGAKAELAGKKGKCLQCGQAALVPEINLDEAGPGVATLKC